MSDGRGYWNAPVMMTPAAQQWHAGSAITSPYDNNPLHLTLLVLCIDQASTIVATLDTIVEAMRVVMATYEIIVIDDASTDHSARLLRRYVEEHSTIRIILRLNPQRKGLAQNYIDAAFMGRGKYFRLIPNDEPMETMVDILKTAGEADIIVPYYVESMQERTPRQGMRRCYAFLVNLAIGHRINDYHSSPIYLRFNVMRWHGTDGFGYQTALLWRQLSLGFTCKQVPCRTTHLSGIGWREILSLPRLLPTILRHRLANNKIFKYF